MKRVLLYLLILSFAFSNTVLKEILKAPSLSKHFIEHHHLDPSVTFVEFLSMHYWGKDLPDNDNEKDMKLPFKEIGPTCYQVLFQNHAITYIPQNIALAISCNTSYCEYSFPDRYFDQPYRPPQGV